MKLLTKTAHVAHCPKCYRYQVIEKRCANGRLRLSCGHRWRPSKLIDVGASA